MSKTYFVVGSAKSHNIEKLQYAELKHSLNTVKLIETNIENCDYLIFVNHNKKYLKKYLKLKRNPAKLILIRLEPPAVLPVQYKKKVEKNYDLIIDPGVGLKSSSATDFIPWPYRISKDPANPDDDAENLESVIEKSVKNNLFTLGSWSLRKNKVVHIAANKVSPTSNSNYRIRRNLVKKLGSKELDVYGHFWNYSIKRQVGYRIRVLLYAFRAGFIPNLKEIYGGLFNSYPNFCGEPEDKHEVLKQYKFSLVIENYSGYASEKLFDAIINASIPIYIGPKRENLFLPENLFIWSDGTVQDIQNILNSMTLDRCDDMLKSMKNYLLSGDFISNWQSENVYAKIATKILSLR